MNATLKNNKRRAKPESDTAGRKLLIRAATHLFAQKGLRGTSIRDIAQQAGLNSSMISYYFGGKELLYKECVKQITESKLLAAKSILTSPKSKAEYKLQLKMFIESILNLFWEERDAGLIIMREFDKAHSPAGSAFKKTFLKVIDLLIQFLTSAQKRKLVSKNQDPYFLATVFYGTLTQQMRMNHLVEKKYKRSLKHPKNRLLLQEQLIQLFE